MTKEQALLEKEAGKLISAIQKEWNEEIGEPSANESMDVMDRAHELLSACKSKSLVNNILGSRSVSEYLGKEWVEEHPRVKNNIQALENYIKNL